MKFVQEDGRELILNSIGSVSCVYLHGECDGLLHDQEEGCNLDFRHQVQQEPNTISLYLTIFRVATAKVQQEPNTTRNFVVFDCILSRYSAFFIVFMTAIYF